MRRKERERVEVRRPNQNTAFGVTQADLDVESRYAQMPQAPLGGVIRV